MKNKIIVFITVLFFFSFHFSFQEELYAREKLLIKTVYSSNEEGTVIKRVVENNINKGLTSLGGIELAEEGEDYIVKVDVSVVTISTSMLTIEAEVVEPAQENEDLFNASKTGTKRDVLKLSRALVESIDKKFLKGKYQKREVDLTEKVQESIKYDIERANGIEMSLQDKVTQFASQKKNRMSVQGSISGETKERPIVFFGASLTRQGKWNRFFPGLNIINYGEGGRTTYEALRDINGVVKVNPKKVFLLIGAADFIEYRRKPKTFKNYEEIISIIKSEVPDAQIFIQSVIPIYVFSNKISEINKKIVSFNRDLKKLALKQGLVYIDLYPVFANEKNQALAYQTDGIHLTKEGYSLWVEELEPYIYSGENINPKLLQEQNL